MTVDVYNYGNL